MNELIINKFKSIAALIFFITLCYLLNVKYDILGLFIDDLTSFTYFPGNNIFEYAFKFYDNATRYRPFYEFFQYIAFFMTGHNPHILYVINIVFNGIIAFRLYSNSKKIFCNNKFALFVSILYLITHFSCYQITQATGLMESIATCLSFEILFLCINYKENRGIRNSIKLSIILVCISFTHERYLSIFGLVFFTYIIQYVIEKGKIRNNNSNFNNKNTNELHKTFLISVILLLTSAIFVVIIRYLALKRFVPAGTSGTYVVDTFSFESLFKFMGQEFLYILGINVGLEAMGGILYDTIDVRSKTIIGFHLAILIIVCMHYLVIRVKTIKEVKDNKSILDYIYDDLIIVMFITLTVLFSSITIFIEKRFILVPFIATYLYILYMCNFIWTYYQSNKNLLMCILFMIVAFGGFSSRLFIENMYRKENDKTYFMVDQMRLNSLAKETVYKYGNEIIDSKQVYILQNSFLYTNRYVENFFTIYQKNYEKRPIRIISELSEEEIKKIDKDKSIILVENKKSNSYYELKNNLKDIIKISE